MKELIMIRVELPILSSETSQFMIYRIYPLVIRSQKQNKINQKSLKSLFENVKEKTDQNKNGNDTTRYEDLSYFK